MNKHITTKKKLSKNSISSDIKTIMNRKRLISFQLSGHELEARMCVFHCFEIQASKKARKTKNRIR